MAHPLDSPELYRRGFRYALNLCRDWANAWEHARDLVQEGYVQALACWKSYDSAKMPLDGWLVMKIKDAWIRLMQKNNRPRRKLVSLMSDVRYTDEKGFAVEPEDRVAPRQENLVYLKERMATCTDIERQKLAEEWERHGEVSLRNVHSYTDWWNVEQRDTGEAINRCESDVWAKQQIARCDLRRKRKNWSRFRLAFA